MWLPCGLRNPLCWQPFGRPFGLRHSPFGLRFALQFDPILLPGQPTPLGQAWAAAHLGSRGDTGIVLLVGQRRAVTPGGGAQPRPPIPLFRGPRISRFYPEPTRVLVAGQDVIHPIAAAATSDCAVKTLACRRAKWAVAAPGPSVPGRRRRLAGRGMSRRGRVHDALFVIRHCQPAALAPGTPACCRLMRSQRPKPATGRRSGYTARRLTLIVYSKTPAEAMIFAPIQ